MASSTGATGAATVSHRPSDATASESVDNESTPLLAGNSDSANSKASTHADPTALYVKIINEHLPWHKRPSIMWLLPIFGLAWISSGMLTSSHGQFNAALLCREYMNRHESNVTLLASEGVTSFLTSGLQGTLAAAMSPAAECQNPEIQAYTAKILAIIEVITGVASTFSIGYYSSLSDKHGRRIIMIVAFLNTLLTLGAILIMGFYWDQVGLPLMVISGLLIGLLGGTSLGITMAMAYAADCTDPAKRSLVFSWLYVGVYVGLAVGPFLGGTIVRATGTIMTIVYIDLAVNAISLLLTAVFMPESLPTKQPPQVQQLYESFKTKSGSAYVNTSQERVAWHSHAVHALSFFKPNGRNTNLILLAAISFLQMLAVRGTLSVVILYTNKLFNWTEYEDGVMYSLASVVRLFTMLVILPILVHYHQRAYRNKKRNANSKANKGVHQDGDSTRQQDPALHNTDTPYQAMLDSSDLDAVASAQYLGENAIEFSSDDHDAQERRNRQTSVDSIATLSSSSNIPNNSQDAEETDASVARVRTRDETFSDMKFDTWMVRLGLAVNAFTYVGYALASSGWVFIVAVSAHAISIISYPSLKSLLTNLVEPSQFGAVLGAIQVVESIAAIFSPVVISWVYALTVKSIPEFVWYSCAAWMAICVVLSFMIRQKQFRNNMVA